MRNISFFVFFLLILFCGAAHAQLVNVERINKDYWFLDDKQIQFGSYPDVACEYDTTQTNDALICGLSTDSEAFILMQKADMATNMALSDFGTPTLVIANSDPTKYVKISHDGTNAVIDSSTGVVTFPDGLDLGSGSMSFGASLVFEGSTADGFETTLTVIDPTSSDKTVTLPNQTGAAILSVGGVADAASAISGGTGAFVFEGSTADAFETSLASADTTASDKTVTLPDQSGTVLLSAGGAVDAANAISGGTGTFDFEGATANGFETSLNVVDPTADQVFSIPNFAVNAAFLASTLTTNTVDAANSVWGASNGLVFEGATADGFETTFSVSDPGADLTISLPNQTGVLHNSGAYSQFSGAAPAAFTGASTTLLITNNVMKLSCNRGGAADTAVTLDETGALPGQIFWAYVDGNANNAGTCSFADSAGVQQTSARTLDDWDTIEFVYSGAEWVELGGVNN